MIVQGTVFNADRFIIRFDTGYKPLCIVDLDRMVIAKAPCCVERIEIVNAIAVERLDEFGSVEPEKRVESHSCPFAWYRAGARGVAKRLL